MLNEISSRTKQCSECGVIAHNSIIQNHTCEAKIKYVEPTFAEVCGELKATKKVKPKTKKK